MSCLSTTTAAETEVGKRPQRRVTTHGLGLGASADDRRSRSGGGSSRPGVTMVQEETRRAGSERAADSASLPGAVRRPGDSIGRGRPACRRVLARAAGGAILPPGRQCLLWHLRLDRSHAHRERRLLSGEPALPRRQATLLRRRVPAGRGRCDVLLPSFGGERAAVGGARAAWLCF